MEVEDNLDSSRDGLNKRLNRWR
ncbi:hypothetical protein Gogos_020376 [Gossypium gossypioides]|uniref:Uncharacterized protein n=1 Tax=Gossypium gossypioides TaxID=34282 RepID=A0A7J9D3X4_GOSGO|nr:hypothetical protein [Gossypium gossypioides]